MARRRAPRSGWRSRRTSRGTRRGRLDPLFVCAGGNPAAFDHKPTFARLRALAAAGVAIGGMSGGAYILARAGLLQRRRCTIHWEHVPALIEEFPDLLLERKLYVFDGDRATCAGGLAAFDMMVDLITRRHGAPLALAVSEWYLRTQSRSGEDAQRISLRERVRVANPRVLKVLALMEERIEKPLSREALAEAAGVTLRQLERLFASHLHVSLADHYLGLRLDRAREIAAPDQPAGGRSRHGLRLFRQQPFFPRLQEPLRADAQERARAFVKSLLP